MCLEGILIVTLITRELSCTRRSLGRRAVAAPSPSSSCLVFALLGEVAGPGAPVSVGARDRSSSPQLRSGCLLGVTAFPKVFDLIPRQFPFGTVSPDPVQQGSVQVGTCVMRSPETWL